MTIDLEQLRRLPRMSVADLGADHTISGAPGAASYGPARDLTRVRVALAGGEVDLYLRNDRVLLAYASGDAVHGLDPAELERRFGPAASMLPSRAGKLAQHRVYAEHGLAASSEVGAVAYLEAFAPMPGPEYVSTLYFPPEPPSGRRR